MAEHHSIIVIGAGLSGLYAARLLQKQHRDVIILEARERLGGRILSSGIDMPESESRTATVDLGPAWIWPQLQPRMQQLLSELDIKLFKQFTQGDMLYEQNSQNIERYSGQSSHQHSYRIAGGNSVLTQAIGDELTASCIHLNTRVTAIEQQQVLSIKGIRNEQDYEYTADKIILALPLRLMQQMIHFTPEPDNSLMQKWRDTATWMASHCKIVFIYEKPFWREQGLSGEVFSQYGPLTEIYDGSPADESFYALTSFVGLNSQQRKQLTAKQLQQMCLVQLERLFGKESQKIKEMHIKDWSLEQYTSTDLDLTGRAEHPEYPQNVPRALWNNNLIIAGTESAHEHGGYLEGALESAQAAVSIASL